MLSVINSIGTIIDFFISICSLLWTLVNLLPSPFNVIFNSYLVGGIALYLWKVYKGGQLWYYNYLVLFFKLSVLC